MTRICRRRRQVKFILEIQSDTVQMAKTNHAGMAANRFCRCLGQSGGILSGAGGL